MTGRLAALLIATVVLAVPGSAQAVTIVGPAKYQRWADRSQVPTPKLTVAISFDASSCHGAAGCSRLGTIYLDPSPQLSPRHVFLYELGHEVDYAGAQLDGGLSDQGSPLRAAYEKIRGLSETWWGDGIGVGAYGDSPGELFADDYAFCAETDRAHLALDSHTMRRVCALIRRVGRRYGST